jgi:hypothetical protein
MSYGNDSTPYIPDDADDATEPRKKSRSTYTVIGRAQKQLEKKNEISAYLTALLHAWPGYESDFNGMKGRPSLHPAKVQRMWEFAKGFVTRYDNRRTSTVKVCDGSHVYVILTDFYRRTAIQTQPVGRGSCQR